MKLNLFSDLKLKEREKYFKNLSDERLKEELDYYNEVKEFYENIYRCCYDIFSKRHSLKDIIKKR